MHFEVGKKYEVVVADDWHRETYGIAVGTIVECHGVQKDTYPYVNKLVTRDVMFEGEDVGPYDGGWILAYENELEGSDTFEHCDDLVLRLVE